MLFVDNPKANVPLFGSAACQQKAPVAHTRTSTSNADLTLFLKQQGLFSSGLVDTFLRQQHKYPLRIWIVDNSLAMNVHDSHRISSTFESIPATRWDELKECVAFHGRLSICVPQTTRFALLNPPSNPSLPQYISVGQPGVLNRQVEEWELLKNVMTHTQPQGPTRLVEEIVKLKAYIQGVAPQLRQSQQKVTIVLATQGLPSEGGAPLIQALRSLEGLPISMVIRLCTDDENVCDFYNSLDSKLGTIHCEVLDDFFAEALEVFLRNPWLTYGLGLHRFREIGFYAKEFDALDERALTLHELRGLCQLLFTNDNDAAPLLLPDPTQNWNAFLQAVAHCQSKEALQWNPVTRRMAPWINLQHLHQVYGAGGGGGGGGGCQFSPSRPCYPTSNASTTGAVFPPSPQSSGFKQQHQKQPSPSSPSSTSPQHQQWQQWRRPDQDQPGGDQQPPGAGPRAINNFQKPQHGPQTTAPNQRTNLVSSTRDLKRNIMSQWALEPPSRTNLQSIQHLLRTVQTIFPPAFGVEPHDYFKKWKPFSMDALSLGEEPAVLKRAIKQMRFFLHPDKLPKDFTEKQSLLCKTIWDVIADAIEVSGVC